MSAPKLAFPGAERLYTEYWLLRDKGHGIIGGQCVLVDTYEGVTFSNVQTFTHPTRNGGNK